MSTSATSSETSSNTPDPAIIAAALEQPAVAEGSAPQPLPETAGDGMFQQSFAAKWGRRAISFPALFLFTALYGVALVVLLPYAAISDIVRGRKGFLLVRFHLFIFSVIFMQCRGIFVLTISWFKGLFADEERRKQINLDVEISFIPKTIGVAEKIYGMRFELEDIECCKPGPIFLFSRHASILDTITPIKFLGQAHGMGMRIVQKAELLWNPLVDVASHRMPRAFIKRGSGEVDKQVGHMKHLLSGITNNEALVVFPEGSRFSEKKKERIVAKIAQSNPIAAERAAQLKTLLPVRPAGAGALLESRPDMDVVFLAHTGLEGANRLEDFINGALYKRVVKVKFWRVAAKDIPKGREERIQWLHKEWSKMDAWILENRED